MCDRVVIVCITWLWFSRVKMYKPSFYVHWCIYTDEEGGKEYRLRSGACPSCPLFAYTLLSCLDTVVLFGTPIPEF